MPITIKSSVKGYRRAGMAHSNEAVTHDDGTFTDVQIAQLEADPRLTVTIVSSNAADSSNSNSNPQGPMDAERLRSLVEHIASLDKENPALWKQDQTPKADAFPKGTTAEEREAAWSTYVETLDSGADSNDGEGEQQ